MHHLIMIAILAAATALGFIVFTNLLRSGDGTHVAESTIGTTVFLAAPALAQKALGWPLTIVITTVALGIYAAILLSGPSAAFLRRVAPWLSASLLLLCLPYIQA